MTSLVQTTNLEASVTHSLHHHLHRLLSHLLLRCFQHLLLLPRGHVLNLIHVRYRVFGQTCSFWELFCFQKRSVERRGARFSAVINLEFSRSTIFATFDR